MTDWVEWHRQYDDPGSSLSRRLAAVRLRIAECLEVIGEGSILSLCAGDGRDVLAVVAPGATNRIVLVEQNPALVAAARQRVAELGLPGAEVVEGDAGDTTRFASTGPVDLLLLCGIFGNVSEADILATVAATPALVRPGGFVIWTRGDMEPDLRTRIRAWFAGTGLTEVAFDGAPEPFGVGVARMPESPASRQALPSRLFTFVR